MSLAKRLKLVHTVGAGDSLTLTWSQKPWDIEDRAIGGGEPDAAVPSNYVIRYVPILWLHLRVQEGSEWLALVTFLRTVDAAGSSFSVYLDADDATAFTCYLESPSVSRRESIRHSGRDDGDPSVLLFDMAVRRTTETAFSAAYFDG